MRFVITLSDVIEIIFGCGAIIFYIWLKTSVVKDDKKEQKQEDHKDE